MDDGEIEVPKSVRPIMLDAAQETRLGERRGAKKQYRYGKLHIREYDDKYVVHVDKVFLKDKHRTVPVSIRYVDQQKPPTSKPWEDLAPIDLP